MKLIAHYTDSHQILLNDFFIPSIKNEDDFILKTNKGTQYSNDGNYFSNGFNLATKDKIEFLYNELLKTDEDEFVLFSDVDIIFIKPIKNLII